MEKPSVVLIVEDDALLAEMALEMIEEAGLPAVAVDSVDAALDYLKENAGNVAAMFSDVRLKGPLNGVELAAFVAVRWPEIAICVTSGVALERPYRLPKNARFMPKPWKALEVISFVEQAARPGRVERMRGGLGPGRRCASASRRRSERSVRRRPRRT